ncbi:MAG: VCBS repeat-containing protein [Pseudomonadota bacterium]
MAVLWRQDDRTSPNRIWLFTVILSALMMPWAQASDELFDRFTVDIGVVQHPTVLTAFLQAGEVADIVVLSVKGLRREVSVYGFNDQGWQRHFDVPLPPETHFVDIATVNEQEYLIAYVADRILRLDLTTQSFQTLVTVPTTFHARRDPALLRIHVARDLNGNGRDDLVMPDVDGFWISLQSPDGSFSSPVKVGPPEPFREHYMYGDKQSYGVAGITTQTLPWYLSRLKVADITGNGLVDLVFWERDRFLFYPQRGDGSFESDPLSLELNAPFDAVGMYTVAFEFKENLFRLATGLRRKTRTTVLMDIKDVTGDGVPDLTTVTLRGRSVFRLKSSIRVHRGRRTETGLRFDGDATEIAPDYKGTAWTYSNVSVHDSHEGPSLMMYINVPTDIGQFYRIIVRKTMSLHLAIYRFDQEESTSVRTMKIKPTYDSAARKGPFFPATLLGDVTGNGHLDLLVGDSWNTLHVYAGTRGEMSFAETPIPVTVSMTSNENNTRLVSLTREARKGLLVEHFSEAPSDASRLEVLLPVQWR